MTILLTGATGFIGRHLLRLLLADGHGVRVVVRPGRARGLPAHPLLRLVECELAEVKATDLDGCEVLIHMAAYGVVSGTDDWTGCFKTNVTDSLVLWLRAAEAGVRRFVICGSCFEYGRSGERYEWIPVDAPLEPTGAYHSSKAAATIAALGVAVHRNVEMLVLRPFHVFGEGEAPQRFWPALREAALSGRDFPMTRGEQIRDFVPVEMVARSFIDGAVRRRLEAGWAEVVNIGTGQPRTLIDFATEWWRRWGASGRLLPGQIRYRVGEVMRYVPLVEPA